MPYTNRQQKLLDEMWSKDPDLIRRFYEQRPRYQALCNEVEHILRHQVEELGIRVASVSSRAKTLVSFIEKIDRKKYKNPMRDIEDFAGVRVVCLFPEDIAPLKQGITDYFNPNHVIDKSELLKVREFGYRGYHLVGKLGSKLSGSRYDGLKNLKCEIQIRTVMQDAWSILNHYIVYKREAEIPDKLLNDAARYEALLQQVDKGFSSLNKEMNTIFEAEALLEEDLNDRSFREYLQYSFSDHDIVNESQYRGGGSDSIVVDILCERGYRTIRDVNNAILRFPKEVTDAEGPVLDDGMSLACHTVLCRVACVDLRVYECPDIPRQLRKYITRPS